MIKTTLLLIRHGETDWNVKACYQGQKDTILTSLGTEQMKQVERHLEKMTIDIVFSSPLSRAKQSAQLISFAMGCPFIVRPQLQEMDMGSWVGRPYRLSNDDDWLNAAQHGGEKSFDFLMRLKRFTTDDLLCPEHKGENESENKSLTYVVVTHGLVIQGLLSLLTNESFETWHSRPLSNGSITRVELSKEKNALVFFNSVNHL